MRVFLLLVPAVLLAQTAAQKSTPPKVAPKSAPTGAAKSAPPKAAPKAAPGGTALTTDDEKTVYAVGLQLYKQLGVLDLSPAELEVVKRAISDAAAGKPAIDLNQWAPKIGAFAAARQKNAAKAYFTKAMAQPGAMKTDSGIVYRHLKQGTGASPKASDTVKVNYRGTLTDGTEFDSSYKRNEPAQFPLTGVIKCWTEGVQKMKVGGKIQLVCPSDLAYGDRGMPPTIPGGATLVFEIELLDIVAGGR